MSASNPEAMARGSGRRSRCTTPRTGPSGPSRPSISRRRRGGGPRGTPRGRPSRRRSSARPRRAAARVGTQPASSMRQPETREDGCHGHGLRGDVARRPRRHGHAVVAMPPRVRCPLADVCLRFRSRFSRTRSANVVWSTTSEIAWRTRPQNPKKWHSPWNSHSLWRDWLTQSTGAIGPSTIPHDLADRDLLRRPGKAIAPLRAPLLRTNPPPLSWPRITSRNRIGICSRSAISAIFSGSVAIVLRQCVDCPERVITLRRHAHRRTPAMDGLAESSIFRLDWSR